MQGEQDTRSKVSNTIRRWRSLRPITVIFVVVLGVCIFFGVSYFQSLNELTKLKQAAAESPDQQANDLVRKVSEHMVLPTEKPTIATVEDTKKLSDQTFFKNAKKGDKVLVYTKNKKAVLYRPSDDKVIEAAHLSGNNK